MRMNEKKYGRKGDKGRIRGGRMGRFESRVEGREASKGEGFGGHGKGGRGTSTSHC